MPDEVSGLVREVVEGIIGAQEYSNEMVKSWGNAILNHICNSLIGLQKAFKYNGKSLFIKYNSLIMN